QRIRPAGQVEVAAEFFCVVNGVFFFVCVDGDFAGFQVDVGGLDRHIALVVVLRGAGRELDVRVQQIQPDIILDRHIEVLLDFEARRNERAARRRIDAGGQGLRGRLGAYGRPARTIEIQVQYRKAAAAEHVAHLRQGRAFAFGYSNAVVFSQL